MTIEKSELKILMANEIGASLEDMLETAKKTETMHAGAKNVLADACKNVGGLEQHLQSEIDNGTIKFDELKADPPKIQALVRKYIARAMNILDNMRVNSTSAQIGAAGMVAAYESAMSVPKMIMAAERGKLEAVKEAMEQELSGRGEEDLDLTRPRARSSGVHPGDPLAARRMAELPPEMPVVKKANGKGRARARNTR